MRQPEALKPKMWIMLCKTCPYSALFWFVFPLVWTEYRNLLCKSPYLIRMKGNMDQKTLNTDPFHAVLWSNLFYKLKNKCTVRITALEVVIQKLKLVTVAYGKASRCQGLVDIFTKTRQ